MKPEYAAWIAEFIARHKRLYGRCMEASHEASVRFPELRIARGYCVDARLCLRDEDFYDEMEDGQKIARYPAGGPAHVWCVAPDGTVVDATADQFGMPPEHRQYVEHDDARHGMLPRGKCMNCGFYAYREGGVCSDECREEIERDLNRGSSRASRGRA